MKMKRNRIPESYLKITAKLLVDIQKPEYFQNLGIKDDILHIYKNENGNLSLNLRTKEYTYIASSWLRDTRYFEFLRVEK